MRDINAGAFSSHPESLRRANGRIFFLADDGLTGKELWVSDGTAAQTALVKDVVPGYQSSNPDGVGAFAGVFLFSHGGLWRTDGTAAGTVLVKNTYPSWHDSHLALMNGLAYFLASGPDRREGLWRTDGTSNGTLLVKDVGAADELINAGSRLFFAANDGNHGVGLWTSDGTEAGTVLVSSMRPGGAGSWPSGLTDVGGTVFFRVGYELWRSNGTAAGTVMVKDFTVPRRLYEPSWLTAMGNALFLSADDGTHGHELWRSDGTTSGTVMVSDIRPGPSSSDPSELVVFHGALMLRADNGTHGAELWKSDGTTEGTLMVSDIAPGPDSSYPDGLCVTPSTLFFQAEDASGSELWAFGPAPALTPATSTPTPPAGPNHPPTVDRFDHMTYIWTADVFLEVVDPDGDPLRWTITLSPVNPWFGIGALDCSRGCTAISTTDTSISGLVRSGRKVELHYRSIPGGPDPPGDVTLTVTASDGRGGEAAPQTIQISKIGR